MYLKIFLSIIIFCVVIWKIDRLIGTTYGYADEVGYWGTAASIVGKDWSGIMSNISYYSFVYALFLVPIMICPASPEIHYQMAIVLNAIILVAVFWLACCVTHKLMKKKQDIKIMIVCFAATMYPTYIFYSKNTSGEILYLFFAWCAVWACVEYINNQNIPWLLIFIAIAFLNFAAHMRSISIVCASIIVILVINLIKRRYSHIFICLGQAICLTSIFLFLKQFVQSAYYGNNDKLANNDIAGQKGKLSYLFSSDGIEDFFHMVLGRSFYLSNATFLLLTIAVIFSLLYIYRIYSKEKMTKTEAESKNSIVLLWLLMCLFFSVAVSALFFQSSDENIYYLFYGRYTDYLVMPFLIIGMFVVEKILTTKMLIFVSYIHFIICKYMYVYMIKKGIIRNSVYPNIAGNAGLLSLFEEVDDPLRATLVAGFIAIVVLVLIYCIQNVIKEKNNCVNVIAIVVMTIWGYSAFEYVEYSILSEKIQALQKSYVETADIIDEKNTNKGDVLFISDGDWHCARISHYLQFKIPNTCLKYYLTIDTDYTDIEWEKYQCIILGTYMEYDNFVLSKVDALYNEIYSNQELVVYCLK